MTKLIAVAAFAFVAFTAALGASSSARADDSVKCMSSTTVSTFKVNWLKPSNGKSCNGSVRASDFAKVASLAAKGKTKFMIRFEIVTSVCPSGIAKMPAELKDGILTTRPWDKSCVPGEFNTAAR